MGETFARGDKWVDRGTPIVDSSRDLCPGNVGGQIVGFPYILVIDATSAAGTKMKFSGSTNTYAVPYKSGSVVGLGVSSNTAFGASRHATFTVYIGATSSGFTTGIAASAQFATASQNKDTDAFAAGKQLSVLCEHASATTYTVAAVVYVEM